MRQAWEGGQLLSCALTKSRWGKKIWWWQWMDENVYGDDENCLEYKDSTFFLINLHIF